MFCVRRERPTYNQHVRVTEPDLGNRNASRATEPNAQRPKVLNIPIEIPQTALEDNSPYISEGVVRVSVNETYIHAHIHINFPIVSALAASLASNVLAVQHHIDSNQELLKSYLSKKVILICVYVCM